MRKHFVTKFLALSLAAATAATSNTSFLFPITTVSAADGETDAEVVKSFDFSDSAQGWYYGSGWEWQYSGAANTSVSAENGMLKVSTDFSADAGYEWSNLAVCYWEEGMNLRGVNQLTLDVYYETAKLTDGALKIGLFSNAGIDTYADLSPVAVADAETGLSKATITMPFNALGSAVNDFAIKIIGLNTSYQGAFYIDNINLVRSGATEEPNTVTSTLFPNEGNVITTDNTNLVTVDERAAFTDSASLVDPDSNDDVVATYAYLKALGSTDSVIFGHQDDTWQKAGSSSLSTSDVKDVTGSIAGVVGMDALSFTGAEYSASRYNDEFSATTGITVPETAAGNVTAAALIANAAIDDGALLTLSAHMPNFSKVARIDTEDTAHSYAAYDFGGYTPNDLTGDTMNQLLPGGAYNTVYNAYLDMVADFANQVDGTILFRPFHECTGGWFWWGSACCDAETYKSVYKYTVSYLRDTKEIHNMLYVYGPGSEAASTDDYSIRYPGDEYVDMIGFDMYDSDPISDEAGYAFVNNFKNELSIVDSFAEEHNKLVAVTECGVSTSTADAGDNQTALHHSGNQQKDWYNKILDAVSDSTASYFLVWANFSQKDGFYTPYVDSVNEDGTLNGHEMLDNFIDFFNDDRSVFASDQKTILATLDQIVNRQTVAVSPVTTELSGYITAPVSGKRVTKGCTFAATLNQDAADTDSAIFVIHGKNVITVPAVMDGSTVTADVSTETIESAGVDAEGSIELLVNEKSLASISVLLNMEAPVEVPNIVDNFDSYYNYDSLLLKNWEIYHADGSRLDLSLNSDPATVSDGSSSLKFNYSETSGGWAGATIAKSADWSAYNALSFYVVPDGNNQKTVIQITANNTVYEVYLNDYEAYTDTKEPMLVTIPFSAFCQRDTIDHPTGGLVADSASISSLGLWVNAIDNVGNWSDSTISGTLIYDAITAVSSDVKDVTFQVENAMTDLSQAKVSAIKDQTYTGKAITPATNVTLNGTILKAGRDYKVNYRNNKNVGTATITITGQGSYTGTLTTTFKIVKATGKITNVSFSYEKVYGSRSFNLKPKCNGTSAFTFKSSDRSVATISSKGKVTIKGCGIATLTISTKATANYTAAKKEIRLTVAPKKVSNVSVKNTKKNTLTLSWKKNKEATGYSIAYSTSSKFRSSKTTVKNISKNTTTSYQISNLSKNKTYYIRIRAYKKSGGQKVYSSYSSVKKIKTAK